MKWIFSVLALCAVMTLLLCWEIWVYCIDETGDSTLAGFSLFPSSSCYCIKNLAFEIEESLR